MKQMQVRARTLIPCTYYNNMQVEYTSTIRADTGFTMIVNQIILKRPSKPGREVGSQCGVMSCMISASSFAGILIIQTDPAVRKVIKCSVLHTPLCNII